MDGSNARISSNALSRSALASLYCLFCIDAVAALISAFPASTRLLRDFARVALSLYAAIASGYFFCEVSRFPKLLRIVAGKILIVQFLSDSKPLVQLFEGCVLRTCGNVEISERTEHGGYLCNDRRLFRPGSELTQVLSGFLVSTQRLIGL